MTPEKDDGNRGIGNTLPLAVRNKCGNHCFGNNLLVAAMDWPGKGSIGNINLIAGQLATPTSMALVASPAWINA